jgi:hypothetical protein
VLPLLTKLLEDSIRRGLGEELGDVAGSEISLGQIDEGVGKDEREGVL